MHIPSGGGHGTGALRSDVGARPGCGLLFHALCRRLRDLPAAASSGERLNWLHQPSRLAGKAEEVFFIKDVYTYA